MIRIWIDTDIGDDIDDAVALLCAARHPETELVGVSTVYGQVTIRAWLARELLARAGVHVPVLPGAAGRLDRSEIPYDELYYKAIAPRLPLPLIGEDDERVDAIAQAMRQARPFRLLTIGAMTNAAKLLARHPDLAHQWQGVTCMAGQLEAEPEWNIQCDPPAARTVMEQSGPHIVGLEASSETLARRDVERLADVSDPANAFLLECYRAYRNNRPDGHDDLPLTLYDPIGLLSTLKPDLFDFQHVKVTMDSDGRLQRTDDGFQVTYAMSSDWNRIRPLIEGLIGKR